MKVICLLCSFAGYIVCIICEWFKSVLFWRLTGWSMLSDLICGLHVCLDMISFLSLISYINNLLMFCFFKFFKFSVTRGYWKVLDPMKKELKKKYLWCLVEFLEVGGPRNFWDPFIDLIIFLVLWFILINDKFVKMFVNAF